MASEGEFFCWRNFSNEMHREDVTLDFMFESLVNVSFLRLIKEQVLHVANDNNNNNNNDYTYDLNVTNELDCKIYFPSRVIKTKELARKQAQIKFEKDNNAQKIGGKRRVIMSSVPESNDEEQDHESEKMMVLMVLMLMRTMIVVQ